LCYAVDDANKGEDALFVFDDLFAKHGGSEIGAPVSFDHVVAPFPAFFVAASLCGS
jgi:hypothetical protein